MVSCPRYPALCSLEAAGLLQGLEELSGLLEVTLADALALLQQQPTLLLAKVRSILCQHVALNSTLLSALSTHYLQVQH
jgi:hypothetical protein